LAGTGNIHKVHGGATIPRGFGENTFQQRMLDHSEAKMRIAQNASSLFEAGEALFVDTGSTTLYFVEKLSEISGLTIITYSAEIARTVSSSSVRVQSESDVDQRTYLLGGEYKLGNRQTVETMVVSQTRSFRAHHAVLTIGALDGQPGAMDFNIEEAQVARAMIEQSQSLTVLMDATKFNKLGSFEVCPLAKIDRLVVDKEPPDALGESHEVAGVKVMLAH